MANTVTINYEGGDEPYEDGPTDADSDSMGDDSSGGDSNFPFGFSPEDSYSGDAPRSGGRRYRFEKVDPDKLADAEIKRLNIANKRDLRQRQAEAKTELQRRSQDAERAARESRREQIARSAEQIAEIRSNAVAARIQAYSISSFLGIPGYLGASLYDQGVNRPQEQSQIDQMRQYQEQLRAYHAQEDERRRSEKRAAEDDIKNMPVDATNASAVRAKYGLGGTPPGTPPPPGNGGSGGQQPPAGGQGGTGNNPPPPAGNNTQPGGGQPPAAPPPGGGQGGSGAQPPILPPTLPQLPGNMNALLAPFAGIAVAFEAAQRINQRIDAAGKDISGNFRDLMGDSPQRGLDAGARSVRRGFDPLGVNIPMQVAVTGFDTLLSMTEDIRKAADKDLAFSPLSLTNTVEGSIAKLLQSISIAERLDPTKAEVIRLQTQLDMAWEEFKAEMFLVIAPLLKDFMKGVITLLETIVAGIKFSQGFGEGLTEALPVWVQGLLGWLKIIANNTEKDKLAGLDGELLKQMSKFLDPKQARVIFPNP